ncbi:MAG: hypothetical protein ABI705_07605 [Aestuariivirga sp.]
MSTPDTKHKNGMTGLQPNYWAAIWKPNWREYPQDEIAAALPARNLHNAHALKKRLRRSNRTAI